MTHMDRVVASFLYLLTGVAWTPRFDRKMRVYMWLRPEVSES